MISAEKDPVADSKVKKSVSKIKKLETQIANLETKHEVKSPVKPKERTVKVAAKKAVAVTKPAMKKQSGAARKPVAATKK